jgi:hypothetical protein
MLYVHGLGPYIRHRRLELGMTVSSLAERWQSNPQAIEQLEANRPLATGLIVELGYSVHPYNLNVDLATPTTGLFGNSLQREVEEAKQHAFELIMANGLTRDLKIIEFVGRKVAEECFLKVSHPSGHTVRFRKADESTRLTIERITELVREGMRAVHGS